MKTDFNNFKLNEFLIFIFLYFDFKVGGKKFYLLNLTCIFVMICRKKLAFRDLNPQNSQESGI